MQIFHSSPFTTVKWPLNTDLRDLSNTTSVEDICQTLILSTDFKLFKNFERCSNTKKLEIGKSYIFLI